MNIRRDLDTRLSRLEAATLDVFAELLAMIRLDRPLLFGSVEHKEALADPIRFDLANRSVLRRPKLPSGDPGDVWPENPIL